ncbi:MAG: hypothetical protein AB7E31_07035 [Desulfitobacterium sp.]
MNDFKRAATRSSRKARSGVGLETGRFQPAREPNKCEKLTRFSGWRFSHEIRMRISPKPQTTKKILFGAGLQTEL